MRLARTVSGVKKVFVRSGLRYDLALSSPDYLRELIDHHVSGLLKIAPEHVSPRVLRLMNKSSLPLEEFRRLFQKLTGDRKQHLKYYFMAAHPGTTMKEAKELAEYIQKLSEEGEKPVEGVQIFTPTPMTRSTSMYYTGKDPETGQPVYVPRTFEEKKAQKRLLLEYLKAGSGKPNRQPGPEKSRKTGRKQNKPEAHSQFKKLEQKKKKKETSWPKS